MKVTEICVMFGSYITYKKEPIDLDLLFIFEKENFNTYKKTLDKVRDSTPINIHDVVQTKRDIEINIKKKDPIIITAIREGVVLWGFEELVKVIKDVHTRQN